MNERHILRILLANPVRLAFDPIVRESIVPDLRRSDGVVDAWAARRGPGDLGERAIVTTWTSRAAMHAVMGIEGQPSPFHPEHLAEMTDRRLEIMPVRVAVAADEVGDATILRIARGRPTSVDLDTYVAHVAAGARRDLERGRGPCELVLAQAGEDRFVTVSTWRDWEALAAATGASIDRPVRTREQHALEGFVAVHYELLRVP